MRRAVRVKPGASRTNVGGRYGDGTLIVSTNAPAVDGRANDAVVKALAIALDLRPAQVRIVTGHTSRTKYVEVPDECAPKWTELLG